MDYDFCSLCVDQIEKIKKRLGALNKSFIRDYKVALNIINSANEKDHRSETIIAIEDELRDLSGKCEIFYTESMNKIQSLLRKYV